MRNKTAFNRIDKIKDPAAKAEIARAHAMITLLGIMIIILLWTVYSLIDLPLALVLFATFLLVLIILFSAGVTFSTLKSRK